MAIEIPLTSVTALVTGEPRERQLYEGRGEDRKVKGRATDSEGRPVTVVTAVVLAAPIGLLGDANLQLPDIQAAGLVPGAVVRVEGNLSARLSGGDYAAIRSTVAGDRVTPLGQWSDWIANEGRPGKTSDTRQAA